MSISINGENEDEENNIRQIRDTNPDPSDRLQISELNQILLDSFKDIPVEQREVLIMKEYEGLKFREIAEILGISENTAKSRLYYGLGSLKKILKEQNINKNTVCYEG